MIVNRFLCMVSLSAMLLITCISGNSSSDESSKRLPKGMKTSDPHLAGERDLNYDHLIIPGDRIGPVRMGGSVTDAVQHLGNPSFVTHFRGSDEVRYSYTDECIGFTWNDSGIDPLIEKGWRGISVTCDKWTTRNGLHVGSSMQEVGSAIGEYCPQHFRDGRMLIETKAGIWFFAKDRNSPVSEISVMPPSDHWDCAD